jgi:hypothetical protein
MTPELRTDPRVKRIVDGMPAVSRPLAEAMLELIRANVDGLTETVKWGNPAWVGHRNALYLVVFRDHSNLGLFYGADLADRFPRIQGTGKNLRHVKVASVAEASDPELRAIIRAAVALDQKAPKAV